MHAPITLEHNLASQSLFVLLHTFVNLHDLGFVGHEKVMVALSRNHYEPDICFWGKPKAVAFVLDQVIFPAPDFVIEVLSPITARVDREDKYESYAAHGVLEYWLVDPGPQSVEQYVLNPKYGAYELLAKHRAAGDLVSLAVPGFNVPVCAVFGRVDHLKTLRSTFGGLWGMAGQQA